MITTGSDNFLVVFSFLRLPELFLVDCCQLSAPFAMSGIFNLSDSLAAARQCAARSSDQLHSLLSPSPASSSSASIPSQATPYAFIGHQLVGSHISPDMVEGEGASGEFSARLFGSPKGIPLFVLSSDLVPQRCLGAVNGGVKFCTLHSDMCSVSAHVKKVAVAGDHVYISGAKTSAFSNPRLPALIIGSTLPSLLQQTHPRDEWLQIFQGILDTQSDIFQPLSAATPKKRRICYDLAEEEDDTTAEALISSFNS